MVAPSNSPPMVFTAIRMMSTCGSPPADRCDGADDLVDVDRLEPAIPLPHVHAGPGLARCGRRWTLAILERAIIV